MKSTYRIYSTDSVQFGVQNEKESPNYVWSGFWDFHITSLLGC